MGLNNKTIDLVEEFRDAEEMDYNFNNEDGIIEKAYIYNLSDNQSEKYVALDINKVLSEEEAKAIPSAYRNDELFEINKYQIIDSYLVLNSFVEAGRKYYNEYKENKGYPNSYNDIIDYAIDINTKRNDTIEKYNDWVRLNTLPYTLDYALSSDLYSTYEFVIDSVIIFLTYTYLISTSDVEGVNPDTRDRGFKLHKMEKYVTLIEDYENIKNMINNDLKKEVYYSSKPVCDNVQKFEKYTPMEMVQIKAKGESIPNATEEELKNNTINLIVKFLNQRFQANPKKIKFKYNEIIFSKVNNYYYRATVANSLIAVAYDRLLQNFTKANESKKLVTCAHPDCKIQFEKKGNIKYCKACRLSNKARAHIKRVSNQKKKK